MNLNTINKILGFFALLLVAVSCTIIISLLSDGLLDVEKRNLLLQCFILLFCSVWLWIIIRASIKKRRK